MREAGRVNQEEGEKMTGKERDEGSEIPGRKPGKMRRSRSDTNQGVM